MLAYLGVDFEDVKYDVTYDEDSQSWDRSQWTSVKFNLGLEFPNLPYLFDGETKITETVGIMRYLAKKHDSTLLGKTAAELGRIEMLWDTVSNLKAKCTFPAYMGEKDGEELKD